MATEKQIFIKADTIQKQERLALGLLSLGGLCFLLALASYFYAEYEYKSGQLILHQIHSRSVQNCMKQKTIEALRNCYTSAQVDYIEKHKSFLVALKLWFWRLPLVGLTFAIILGYSGLIWWGIYQPASRRPMVAISAIGMLIQTALFIWILVVRFVDLPPGS